jgi:hypothetical protein
MDVGSLGAGGLHWQFCSVAFFFQKFYWCRSPICSLMRLGDFSRLWDIVVVVHWLRADVVAISTTPIHLSSVFALGASGGTVNHCCLLYRLAGRSSIGLGQKRSRCLDCRWVQVEQRQVAPCQTIPVRGSVRTYLQDNTNRSWDGRAVRDLHRKNRRRAVPCWH